MPKTRYKSSTRETHVMHIDDQYRSFEHDGHPPSCINPEGHLWVVSEAGGRRYCEYCLADGDA